jgi:hypothetical protein
MNFIESILLLDTKDFICDISEELELSEEVKGELLKNILKENHFIEKRVKNRYLYLMTKNMKRVNLKEIKSRLEL